MKNKEVTEVIYENTTCLSVKDKKVYKENKKLFKCYVKKNNLDNILKVKDIKLLLKLCVRKLENKKKYVKRLYDEFTLIDYFGFTKVFLQVYEILELAGDIPHIIRGSSGACLLCYLLAITDIDPIKENICLSRFMHKERQSIPDIDIDFPHILRDDIYLKVFNKWKDKVARISNHIMYKEKSAIRQAIREEGYNKMIKRDFNLEDIFSDRKQIERVKKRSNELLNNFRCYSLHCGGIIIFPNKVPDNLVLKDFDIKDGEIGKQIWMNKKQVEDADMIKIDLLSNRGMSQLLDISKQKMIDYDKTDLNVYKVFEDGLNLGLTQAESRGMRKILMTLKPKNVNELAIALALIRPAASRNYQKSAFLRDYSIFNNKSSRSKYIIFDDDATIFIKNTLNCNESIADNIRRAFSKNKFKEKTHFKRLLYRQFREKKKVDKIFEQLEQLRYYSFCKSHAYSYANMVYCLTYQKYYNPKKFWVATLNNCNSSYRKWVHFREAKKSGIKITLGKKPWYFVNNELRSDKSIYPLFNNSVQQYFDYGYWVSDDFLPNMYYEEYWTKLTKRHKKAATEKFIIKSDDKKNILYAKFRGIIATGRVFRKEDKKGFLTFITIASDDGVYHDLVIYGAKKISKMVCISGYGKVKDDGCCRYIDVLKFTSDRL